MSTLFGSRGSAGAGNGPSQAEKLEAIKQEISQQFNLQNAQELTNNLGQQCYKMCIPKPGSSLGSSEETCISRCMDRYLEVFNIVSKTYSTRFLKERDSMALAQPAADIDLGR